jgi:hypothetical protein
MKSQMIKKFFNNKIRIAVLVALVCLVTTGPSTLAAQIEKNPNASVEGYFRVGPAKVEQAVPAGESRTVSLMVENRTGRVQDFAVSFEDFVAGDNPEEAVKLLGDEKSAYSLKDFMSVPLKTFTLAHGDKVTLPVLISMPVQATAGGYFGSVIVSASQSSSRIAEETRTYSGASVVGRIATLVFVSVPGEVVEEGRLENFSVKNGKKIIFGSSIPLRILYRNTGTVALNPYGLVEVKNIFGTTVARRELDPWFALPQSLRTRDVSFDGHGFFGRYTVIASVNRGYDDIVDEESVTVYVVPKGKGILSIAVFAIALWWLRQKVRANKKTI